MSSNFAGNWRTQIKTPRIRRSRNNMLFTLDTSEIALGAAAKSSQNLFNLFRRYKMHRIFQNFVEHLSSATDPEALCGAMSEAAAALDLSCFAYLPVQHRPDATVGLISNYPSAWTRHYLQSHYERFDPVIVQALAEPEPFEWGLGVGSTGRPSQNGSFSRKPLNLVSVAVLRFQFTIMAAQPQR
jgi:hypothetical protein